jgi:quercetin dioxygenase-like cupin family protein
MPTTANVSTNVLLRSEETGGHVSVTEIAVPPHTAGPPLHTHDFDEAFYMLAGELIFQVEDTLATKAAGELCFALRNVPHTLANHGDAPARYVLICTPAGFERHWARAAAEAAGVERDLPPRSRRRAVPVSRRHYGVDAARGRYERGQCAGLPRALGPREPRARGPADPLPQRADLADVHDELLSRPRALALVSGQRTRAPPPPADRAGARQRPARGKRRRCAPSSAVRLAPLEPLSIEVHGVVAALRSPGQTPSPGQPHTAIQSSAPTAPGTSTTRR